MLRLTLQGGERLIERLRSAPATLLSVLSTKLTALMFQLQSRIVLDKLSGQVLAHRTGTLAGSVRAQPTTTTGTTLHGGITAGGGPAFYAGIHEFGVDHPWTITATRARALHFISAGREIFVKSVTHPALPQRAFMAPALAESEESIRAGLQNALDSELEK
jgi:hypothetical protein